MHEVAEEDAVNIWRGSGVRRDVELLEPVLIAEVK